MALHPSLGGWRSRILLVGSVALVAATGLFAAVTKVDVEGRWRGIYLLEGRGSRWLEVKDDLLLGDGSRLLTGFSLTRVRKLLGFDAELVRPGEPSLALDWDEREGRGLVRNRLADGTELVTMFGRYEDSEGETPRGLFVGGAIPEIAADLANQNQSGMALHDARGWTHVWCNVNEALVDESTRAFVWPSTWRFLGSRVLVRDAKRVVLETNHEADVQGATLRMDRFAYFTAGQPYFKLGIQITSLGPADVSYAYLYGDEPWVGRFGSADGNIGWLADRLVPNEEMLDPVVHRWGGILDTKSGTANYIEWVGDTLPTQVYFANEPGKVTTSATPVPLTSNEVFVGLQWVKQRLRPGEERSIRLVIGLAETDPATGRPRRPKDLEQP
jgi:hypothetical protein